MEDELREILKGGRDQNTKTTPSITKGSLRFVDYMGLGCQTSYRGKPHFFLFADVDTKDPETLRLVLQVFATWKLVFYHYETSKGWHVVSPCLMELSDWDRARRELKEVLDNFYRNMVIRVERKAGDSFHLYFDNFNMSQKYKVSEDFIHMMNKRFDCTSSAPNTVKTKLFFTKYTQVRKID